MRTFVSKKHPTRAFVIAESLDDVRALEFFFPITWGFYMLWRRKTGIIPTDKAVIAMIKKFGNDDTLAIGCLQSPKGFVPEDELKRDQLLQEKERTESRKLQVLEDFMTDLIGDK